MFLLLQPQPLWPLHSAGALGASCQSREEAVHKSLGDFECFLG